MNDRRITLRDFFTNGQNDRLRPNSSHSGSQQNLEILKGKIAEDLEGSPWPFSAADVTGKMMDLLDVDLVEIMVGAWSKYNELKKYGDSTKYPPKDTYLVSLAEHTFKTTHHPKVDVLVDGVKAKEIVFDVKLSLAVEGVTLVIRNGQIMGVKTGSCKGKGTFAYKDYPIIEKETESFDLPGDINFEEGIPIS
jgi:hypothetical protein